MKIQMIENILEKQQIARAILEALPDWFGIPEAREEYIRDSGSLMFFCAYDKNRPVGFLSLKETGHDTVEIYVMAVLQEFHRKGIGRELFAEAKCAAEEQGYSFIQVKTVQMGKYEQYDRTNRFYTALGFKEFEVLPTLWDEWNPCQIYVMNLKHENSDGPKEEPIGKKQEDSRQVLSVIEKYSRALDLLDAYDHQNMTRPKGNKTTYVLKYEECMEVIQSMRFGAESDLFGKEKDDSFKGSIGNIYQSFAGVELYGSLEEKAANLLYFITKNHSFFDGNKRIAATMFLYFLDKNDALFVDGEKKIADSTLVALTIMIAESRPEEKEMMISVVMNCMQ